MIGNIRKGSRVVFKHHDSDNFNVGVVLKARFFPTLGKHLCSVISEAGQVFIRLPVVEDMEKEWLPEAGYISLEYTERILPKLSTNLTLLNQGNFRDKAFRPQNLKVNI